MGCEIIQLFVFHKKTLRDYEKNKSDICIKEKL